jgi:chaperone required for assembly of F1-ATPase
VGPATTARDALAQAGYQVMLGHVALKTPGKSPLVLPTRLLAIAVAAEWECQARGKLKPHTMPLTSLAATALDQVRRQARAGHRGGQAAGAAHRPTFQLAADTAP